MFIPKRKFELSCVLLEIWRFAPDDFEYISTSVTPKPTMDTDYERLRKGIEFVFRQKRFNESRPRLLELVEESYSAYTSGDKSKGMALISDIMAMMGKMK